MTTAVRWGLVAVLAGHGLIHLLGAAKGFGWAEVSQLREPIGPGAGALWLVAAVVVLTCAVLVGTGAPKWWWMVAVAGATVSQVAIATSWNDARIGTAVNVLLVVAAVYAFASVGPTSFHAEWSAGSSRAIAATDPTPALVTEDDLADLPAPLAAYLRHSGAVGRQRVTSFEATFHGRIRSDPTTAWMPFTGKQVNTYGARPQRWFIMDATRSGLPVTVLHEFADATATMRAKVLSAITVVDAAGPEMNRGETVTVFNDRVVRAPGAIVDAPVRWTAIDTFRVQGTYTLADQVVTAVLTFNPEHDLVDFVSDDRSRATPDGKSFTTQRWSTPLSAHRESDGRRILAVGDGRWEGPQPEGSFTYVEFHIDGIAYNLRSMGVDASRANAGR